MNLTSQQRKRVMFVLLTAMAFALSIIAITLLRDKEYRIVSISPAPTSLPTSSNTITIETNRILKGLEDQPDDLITSNQPADGFTYTIEFEKLIINLLTTYEDGTEIDFEISGLRSVDDETIDKNISYVSKYVEFSDLDKREQERQVEESAVSGDDNPILSQLPYDEISFRISSIIDEQTYGSAASWQAEKDNYALIVETFIPRNAYSDEDFVAKTLELRQQAHDWIEQQGVSPAEVNIIYMPSDEELAGQEPIGD